MLSTGIKLQYLHKMRMLTKTIYIVVAIIFLFACADSSQPPQQKPNAATNENIWTDVDYEPSEVDMPVRQVSPHAYYVEGPPGVATDNEGFMSNAGFIVTNEGIVVFDALGTPSLAHKLLHKIRAISDQPIAKVIVSHYHADHIYGLQVFKQAGAEIVAPVGAKLYLESEAAPARLSERRESLFPWVDENTYIVTPDVYVEEETEFKLGDVQFSILPLGSTHSHGDMMLLVKTDQVLFSGDLIFQGRIPFAAGANPNQWLDYLNALELPQLKAIIPGHGAVSYEAEQALHFTRSYLQYLYDNMHNAVEELMSFDEAYQSVDWSDYKNLPAFQANRMNAYYMYLHLEQQSLN